MGWSPSMRRLGGVAPLSVQAARLPLAQRLPCSGRSVPGSGYVQRRIVRGERQAAPAKKKKRKWCGVGVFWLRGQGGSLGWVCACGGGYLFLSATFTVCWRGGEQTGPSCRCCVACGGRVALPVHLRCAFWQVRTPHWEGVAWPRLRGGRRFLITSVYLSGPVIHSAVISSSLSRGRFHINYNPTGGVPCGERAGSGGVHVSELMRT